LISARYERGSIVLTSNKGFGEWCEVLGDAVIATVILDRLPQHSYVLNIRGDSYRLREKTQAGRFTSAGPGRSDTGGRHCREPPGVG
jgi:DNA replication protein DnaC